MSKYVVFTIAMASFAACWATASANEVSAEGPQYKLAGSDDKEKDPLTAMLLDIVVGVLLVTFAPVFLWFAEAQVVNYETIIRRCQLATRSVKNINKIMRDYESRPVYVKGYTRAERDAVDTDLGYHAAGKVARLERVVEMFQWSEIKGKDNTGNETVSYSKSWLDIDVNSHDFKEASHHRNPPRHPAVYSTTFDSKQVLVGAFLLNPTQVSMLSKWQPCPVTAVPASLPRDMYMFSPKSEVGFLVFGGSIENPHIGTVRIRYNVVRDNGLVSTIAVQNGMTFRPFVERDAHRTSNYKAASESHVIDYSTSTMEGDHHNENYMSKDQIGAWSNSLDLTEQAVHRDKGLHVERGMQRDASLQLSDDGSDHGHESYAQKIDQFVHSDEPDKQLTYWDHCQCCMSCCMCMCCKPLTDLVHRLADWSIGEGIVLLEEADVPISDMFRHEWSRFTMRTWIIRIVAYVLLGLGLYMVFFGPVVYVLKFIPYVGWLAEKILFFAAMLVGFMEGLLITTLASALHRPSLLAGTMVLITVNVTYAFLFGYRVRMRNLHSPNIFSVYLLPMHTVYLIAVGLALWFGAHSFGWILAGQVLCGLSVVPIGLVIYQYIEEWQFVSYQRKLDAECDGVTETTRLMNSV